MDKLAPLFVSIWTGLVFTTIFIIDNPLINDSNVFSSRPSALLGIAFMYVAGCLALIFLGRFLCRKAGIKSLEKNGFYAQEYYPNSNFYFSANGNDLALDKRTKRIGFSNAAKVFIFPFSDIFDFNVNVEKSGITGKGRIIILQFFMGFKGAVIINVQAENQDNAVEMMRSLRGVVPDTRLMAANRRLSELCSMSKLPDIGFERPVGEGEDPDAPVMSREEIAKEEERRKQAELERFRRLAMERKQQLEAERQRQSMLEEEAQSGNPSPVPPKPPEPKAKEEPAPSAGTPDGQPSQNQK
ncbi:MAG TPA: hypothetical protein DCW68_01035 [Rhodospirillaceae bacterium]|nr:MAG: hypothetical protein A2018_00580 [Alphaproteobacteria bacterium GWF2_58_20]HAU28683.1 hypothetical protein [Rhodospirillaceae bacterium]